MFVFLMLLCLRQVSGLECLLICPCTFCLLNFMCLSNFLISCGDLITLVVFFHAASSAFAMINGIDH